MGSTDCACGESQWTEIHICGDYKLTVTHVAKPDLYPLPQVDDLLVALSGVKVFSKLDIKHRQSKCTFSVSTQAT